MRLRVSIDALRGRWLFGYCCVRSVQALYQRSLHKAFGMIGWCEV